MEEEGEFWKEKKGIQVSGFGATKKWCLVCNVLDILDIELDQPEYDSQWLNAMNFEAK